MGPGAEGFKPLPFALSRVWGADAAKPVAYVLLAEFDIDTGSTLRHQYPQDVPDHEADWLAEKMLPEGVHNREDDFTVFFLHATQPTHDELEARGAAEEEGRPVAPSSSPFLYGLNIVRSQRDSSVRRGAVVKALALISPYHFVNAFRAPMLLALDDYFKEGGKPGGGLGVLQRLYDSLNGLDMATIPRPIAAERGLMRRAVTAKGINEACPAYTPKDWVHASQVRWGGKRIPALVPLYLGSDEMLGSEAGLATQLVKVFGDEVMRIYNAVLAGKRVLFVGHNHAAGDVCRFVMAAASLVSPPLTGIIRRTIPYTNLSDLSFLQVPGYIAGVTNPMFEAREEWWDLLCVCDLPQGKGSCYKPGERAEEEKATNVVLGDKAFRDESEIMTSELDGALYTRLRSGIAARLGEDWVRSTFQDYTQTLLELALDGSTQTSNSRARDDVRKLVKANELRIKAVRGLPEFAHMKADPWHSIPNLPVKGDILRSHLRLLELQAETSEQEAERIYSDLCKALQSEEAVQILLTQLPECRQGVGLFRLASALMHSFQPVRFYACLLLQRLEAFDSTRPAVESLNKLLLMAYRRVTEEMTAYA